MWVFLFVHQALLLLTRVPKRRCIAFTMSASICANSTCRKLLLRRLLLPWDLQLLVVTRQWRLQSLRNPSSPVSSNQVAGRGLEEVKAPVSWRLRANFKTPAPPRRP